MPNEPIDSLKIELSVDWKKAAKDAKYGGEKAADYFAKAMEERLGKYNALSSWDAQIAKARSTTFTKTGRVKRGVIKGAVAGSNTYAKLAEASTKAQRMSQEAWKGHVGAVIGAAMRRAKEAERFSAMKASGNYWTRQTFGDVLARNGVGGSSSLGKDAIAEMFGVSPSRVFGKGEQTQFEKFKGGWDEYLKQGATNAERFKSALESVKNALPTIGKSVKTALLTPFKNVAKTVSDTHKRLEKFRATISRIILYRTIRSLMSSIKKAVQEGIENLYKYSQILGTMFADSMDTIASSALFIKNSFASMVAPIVDKIAPAIRNIAEYIGNAANEMAEFFTIVTKGTNVQYTRAIWFMKKYKEEANGAKKMLDLLGIDEINRLTDKSGSGTDDDYARMFEEAISGEGNSFATALGNSIKNDDWDSVGKILAQKLNDVLAYVKESDIASGIGEKINKAVKTVRSFLDGASFNQIAPAITGFLKKLNINWEEVGQAWAVWKTNIFDAILGLFEDAEWWGKVGNGLGNFFKGALDHFSEWISDHDWEKETDKLFDSIESFIKNVDWEAIKNSLATFFTAAIKGAAQLLKGLFENLVLDAFYIKRGGAVDNLLNTFGIVHSTEGANWNFNDLQKGAYKSSDVGTVFNAPSNGHPAYGSARELALLAELDKYATGGYVPQGDLFIANEAGPELVGTMNGRTYVGSNSDINSVGIGIENAVYAMANMVVQAIERKDTTVSLDGDKLSKAVSNRQNLAALARG